MLSCTGQKECFDVQGRKIDCSETGQDGAMQLGRAWPCPRFTVADDMVHDRLTDLFWTRYAGLTGAPVAWLQAFEIVSDWGKNRTDEKMLWRLPTINELASLVDCSTFSPALPKGHPFMGLQTGYWASTTSFFETNWAWVLYLDKGACGVGYKPGKTFYIWPVGIRTESKRCNEMARCSENVHI